MRKGGEVMPGPVYCRLKESDVNQIVKIIRDRDNYSEPENIRAKQIELPKGIVEGGRFIGHSGVSMIEKLSGKELFSRVRALLEKGKPFVTKDGEKLVLWKMITLKEHINPHDARRKEAADISKIEKAIGSRQTQSRMPRSKFWEEPKHFPKKTKSEAETSSFLSVKKVAPVVPKKILKEKVADPKPKSKIVKPIVKSAVIDLVTESVLAKTIVDYGPTVSTRFVALEEPMVQAEDIKKVEQEAKTLEKSEKAISRAVISKPSIPEKRVEVINPQEEFHKREVVDVPENLAVAISENPPLVLDCQYPPLPEIETKKRGPIARTAEDAQKVVNKVFQKAKIIGYKKILLSEIRPFKGQPRKYFSTDAIQRLAVSIEENGQKQLVIVMPINDPVYEWELVDGECRYRASILAKEDWIHCCIVEPMERREQFLYSVLSNMGRENHNELEEAFAFAQVKSDYNFTIAQVAKALCKEPSMVMRRLALLKLHPEVQAMLDPDRKNGNSLSISVANFLTKIKVQDEQLRMATTILEKKMNLFEARNFIRSEIHSNNLPVRTRKRSPADDYVKFNGLIERIGRDAGVYLDMKEEQFLEMLARRYSSELDGLIQKMEGVISILTNLKQIIRSPAR